MLLHATTMHCIALHSKRHAHATTPLQGAYHHARDITEVLYRVEYICKLAACHT